MFLEIIADCLRQNRLSQIRWDAHDAKFTATEAQIENRHFRYQIQTLEESVDRLSLAAMALAEILRDRLGVTQNEIDAKIQEIDLRDGLLDGRLRAPTNDCAHCQHTNAGNRRKCLYCGEPLGAITSVGNEKTEDEHAID